jgi:hypothetical protein
MRSGLLLDRLLRRQILESNTTTAPQRFSGRRDSPQELGMVLQPIVEPVVLALEADQHASRLPVSGDENLLGFSQTQKSRQIVFDFSQAAWRTRRPVLGAYGTGGRREMW